MSRDILGSGIEVTPTGKVPSRRRSHKHTYVCIYVLSGNSDTYDTYLRTGDSVLFRWKAENE